MPPSKSDTSDLDTAADRLCGWPERAWHNTLALEHQCNEDTRAATPIAVGYSKSAPIILGYLREHGASNAAQIEAGTDLPAGTVRGQLRRMRDAMTIRFQIRRYKSKSYYVYMPD